MNATVRARSAFARLRDDGHRTTSFAQGLRQRSLLTARAADHRFRAILGQGHDGLPVEPDDPSGTAAPSGTRRLAGAHRQGLAARLLRSVRARSVPQGLVAAGGRLTGRERIIPLTVAGLVLAASVLSVAPAAGQPGGDETDPRSDGPRLVVGGGVLGPADDEAKRAAQEQEPDTLDSEVLGVQDVIAGEAIAEGDPDASADEGQPGPAIEAGEDQAMPAGPYLADGTLLKPVAVDPTVPDSRDRLRTYRVKSGDTLTGIAKKFDVSMMTVWWANKLSAKDDLKVGQQLVIPPVDGLVVTVQAGETLDAIAARTGRSAAEILRFNELTDSTLVVGQVLMVPGALGAAIATPTPKPAAKPAPAKTRTSTSSRVTVRQPTSYRGGRFGWPVPGHRVSQYYHYGHYGIDIAGDTGDRVYSAAAGTVIYAGWRSNGGGYVVWISHGSGLYTTYNHLSAVLVGKGRSVARGQVVGRIGATGWATGSHLHFEVWRGGVPGGPDRRVNPMAYY